MCIYCDILSLSYWHDTIFCFLLCHAIRLLSKWKYPPMCSFFTACFPIWIWKPRARIRVRIFLYAIFAGVADIFNNTFNNIQMRHFGTRLKPNIYTILKEMFDLLVVKYNSLRIMLRYYVYSKGVSISSLVSFKVVLVGVLTRLPLSRPHLNKILSILHLCQKKNPVRLLIYL